LSLFTVGHIGHQSINCWWARPVTAIIN